MEVGTKILSTLKELRCLERRAWEAVRECRHAVDVSKNHQRMKALPNVTSGMGVRSPLRKQANALAFVLRSRT